MAFDEFVQGRRIALLEPESGDIGFVVPLEEWRLHRGGDITAVATFGRRGADLGHDVLSTVSGAGRTGRGVTMAGAVDYFRVETISPLPGKGNSISDSKLSYFGII